VDERYQCYEGFMSYQVYKVLHIAAIFVFLSGAAVLLLSDRKAKFWKITTGIASFFILLGGMGLMARLYPGEGFQQKWIHGKLVIWLIVTGLGHLVAKRFPGHGMKAYWAIMILAVCAAFLAVYKPF
jgi:uncharacterized membrane protein SirB2